MGGADDAAGQDSTREARIERAVTVRSAGPADADVAGALTERVYRAGGWAGEAYARVLRDGQTRLREALLFVAVLDDRIVGTVTLALPGSRLAETARADESEIRMLAVDERARGRGVGSALLTMCEERARQAGLAGVVLSTEPDMRAAHALYARRGYRREQKRDWQINGFRMLVYRKSLAVS